jgi:hypothetical protein
VQSSGIAYGIGTYIQQLADFLKSRKDISLNIIIRHTEVSEFLIKEENGYKTLFFPQIKNQYISSHKYNRNVWFLIRSNIKLNNQDQLIFHLNYYDENDFIPYFKQTFSNCKVIQRFSEKKN